MNSSHRTALILVLIVFFFAGGIFLNNKYFGIGEEDSNTLRADTASEDGLECIAAGGNGCSSDIASGEILISDTLANASCSAESQCVRCSEGYSWEGDITSGNCTSPTACRDAGGEGCTFKLDEGETPLGDQGAFGCTGALTYCVSCDTGAGYGFDGESCTLGGGDGNCADGYSWNGQYCQREDRLSNSLSGGGLCGVFQSGHPPRPDGSPMSSGDSGGDGLCSDMVCNFGTESCGGSTITLSVPNGQTCQFEGFIQSDTRVWRNPLTFDIHGNGCTQSLSVSECGPQSFSVTCSSGPVTFSGSESSVLNMTNISEACKPTSCSNDGSGGELSGGVSGGGSYDGGIPTNCSELNDCGFRTLALIQDGHYENDPAVKAWVDDHKKNARGSPLNMFQGGGSENHTVTWSTVRYLLDNDPSWFEQYTDVWLGNKYGFEGKEMGSNTYQSLNTGSQITVLNHAQDQGHSNLAKDMSKVLRAYWAFLSLGTHGSGASGIDCTHRQNGDSDPNNIKDSSESSRSSPAVAIPGRRNYVNSSCGRGSGLQSKMLAIALGNSVGTVSPLDVNLGFYGGLRASIRSYGVSITNGSAQPKAIPPEKVGLTSSERQKLKDFIASNGSSHRDEIISWISDFKPFGSWTFYRTSEGIAVWLGDDDTWTKVTSPKGGATVAAFYTKSDRKLHFLSRTVTENYPTAVQVRRVGNEICVKTSGLDGEYDVASFNGTCRLLPGGSLIYHFVWNQNGIQQTGGG